MSNNIYCERGSDFSFEAIMQLLNISFGFLTPETDLRGLLPKLYREELRPQDANYVVVEDGEPVAAVGAYDHEIRVCGRTLPCRSVGNVAVHPNHRSKGYMKLAMNAALRDMIEDGIAISALGGRRQRYLYYGYDKAATSYKYTITRENIHHVFGDFSAPFSIREVNDRNDPVIEKIIALNDGLPFTPVRPREEYLYIANSWKAKLLVAEDGDNFVGYFILNGGRHATEVATVQNESFIPFIRSIYAFFGEDFSLTLFPYQMYYRMALTPFAEDMSVGFAMQFNILNYRSVAEAFLALKLTYTKLPDGEVKLLVHGYAGDERICIAVKNGEQSVTVIDDSVPVDYELSHAEAIEFLFSPISPRREAASELARLYFPLPLCMRMADEV